MPNQFGTVYQKIQTLTAVVNSPIVVTNASAAFITGTGTGIFNIKYRIVAFA